MSAYFPQFYGTVLLTGLVLAFIMPRIYPLASKKEEYIDKRPFTGDEEKLPEGYNVFTHGLENALETANKSRSLGKVVADGMKNVLDMWIGVAPVVMAFGTVALILAEYTGIFTFLGKPFEPILTGSRHSGGRGSGANDGCRICGYVPAGYSCRRSDYFRIDVVRHRNGFSCSAHLYV